MPRNRNKYLYDMLDSCRFLVEFSEAQDVKRYISDRAFRRVVERELQIIGEAMLQLRSFDPATAEKISDHARIIGFRHVLVHGYDAIDPDTIWFVIEEKLPVLQIELEGLLGCEPDG